MTVACYLKQQKFFLSQLRGPEVWNQVWAELDPAGGSEGESVPGFAPSSSELPATLGLWLHHSDLCLCLQMATFLSLSYTNTWIQGHHNPG